jgi:protein-glutamine gamma-glutamyltransferase
MEQLSTVLAASIVLLSILSSLIFAFAEGGATAALTLPVGLIAWFLSERREGFALPKLALNVLGFTAVIVAAYELYMGSIEARLLAGGHLIVYLSWLFLFQARETRAVWWLSALSVLQIAVASVLTSAPWFGAALILWLLLAMWTMAIFTMQRSAARTLHPSQSTVPLPAEESLPSPRGTVLAGSYCVHGLRPDDRFRLLSGRFVASVAAMTLVSMLVSVLFFIFIPRVWMSRMRLFDDTALAGDRVAGFTERVRLGDIGEIMASNDVALTATFYEYPSNRRWNTQKAKAWLGENPLFRARTLERYSQGRWDPVVRARGEPCPAPSPEQKLVRVDVRLNSGSAATLFTVGQVVTCDGPAQGSEIFRRRLTNEYSRQDEATYDSYSYQVYSLPEPEEIEFDLSYVLGRGWQFPGSSSADYARELLELPDNLTHLKRITGEILATLPASAHDDDELKAKAILTYLRDSGRFEYTTKAAVDNTRIDPIEDFLINRKKGHCEYFASALALMFRAADIPARLVTGFKGGAFEGNTGSYFIQQRFAHAWVEARIFDRWVVFDPTPAVRDTRATVAAMQTQSSWNIMKEALVRVWLNGIGMNSQQQRDQVYLPLQRVGQRSWQRLLEFRIRFETFWASTLEMIRNPDQWISWRGGLTAFFLLSAIALLWKTTSRIARKLGSLGRKRSGDKNAADEVPFFARFKQIVDQAGLVQERSQTAQEFGQTVKRMLGRQLDEAGLTELPQAVSDEFYRVRFGGEKLSTIDEDRIERRLWRLEACLSSDGSIHSDSHDLRSR